MDRIAGFRKSYLEKHPLFYMRGRAPKVKKARKMRDAKYGHKGDPGYYRNRYAMNPDYRQYVKEYPAERCKEDPDYIESLREHNKDRQRHNRLVTFVNGKPTTVKVKKRQWPGHCELCNKENRKLFYHHWDDNNMSLGLWLCLRCHMFAENADVEGIMDRYIELKKKVTSSLILP